MGERDGKDLRGLLLQKMLSSGVETGQDARPAHSSGERIPASATQKRLWFLDQLNGPNSVYNVPFRLLLSGELDRTALDTALNTLLDRHEILRTTFTHVDDAVLQVVGPATGLPVREHDLRGRPAAERDPEADRLVAEEARRPFRLDGEPLVRALLLRRGEREHDLVLTLHHTVTDGWSEGVLFRELGVLYSAAVAGVRADLPEPRAQYGHYAEWEAAQHGGPLFEAQLAHWRERLGGGHLEAGVPADRPRPQGASGAGGSVPVETPADLAARFARWAGGDVSLFTGVLTALAVLLHRYGGQDSVVVGVPVANRVSEEWESVLGFFANTVALRVDLADDPTLAVVAERVRAAAVDALSHQNVPFDRVVDALGARRAAGMNPVFQVMCSVNAATPPPAMAGLEVELRSLDNDSAKFDLEFAVEHDSAGVECRFEYAADLFDRDTVERMARHYRLVLDLLLAEPGARVGSFALGEARGGDEVVDRYGHPAPIGGLGVLWRDGAPTGEVARVRADGTAEPVAVAAAGPAEEPFAPPATATEQALAAMWAEVLGRARIGRGQHFFDGGGGDSLLATKVVVRVRKHWRLRITVRVMLQFPVLRDLAAHLDTLLAEPAGRPTPDVAPGIAPPVVEVPLSAAQQRLWFIQQMDPDTTAYNIAQLLDLTGPLRPDALRRAIARVCARHNALRTTVAVLDSGPVQRVAATAHVDLPVHDEPDPAAAERAANAAADRPFDLTAGPLLRVELYRLGPDRHYLSLVWHHLVFDGWSQEIFHRELSAFYREEVEGVAAEVPEPAIQYTDYTRWQRAELAGGELDRLRAHWAGALLDPPALVTFPGDHPRPGVLGPAGASRFATLPADLTAGLRAVAADLGVTLYQVLLSAFAVLLGRHSRQDDVVLGITTANRGLPEAENVIGFFVNTLALRADLSGDPAFTEVVRRVQDSVLSAYAHQELPFEQVVEAARAPRSLSQSPLFQVLFDYQEGAWVDLDLPGLTVRQVDVPDTAAMFDFVLMASVGADGVRLEAQYSTDLFEDRTVARLLARWLTLLHDVVRAPTTTVRDLRLLPGAELDLVLGAWSAARPAAADPPLVAARVQGHINRAPHDVALVHGDRTMTYGELGRRADRVAAHLACLGVGRGHRVMVCLPRSFGLVVGSLAALRLGAAFLPVDPGAPAARLAGLVRRARPDVVLTGADRPAGLPAALDVDALACAVDAVAGFTTAVHGPDDTAYVVHTSGSTGHPKGAALDHRGFAHRVDWYVEECAMTPGAAVGAVCGTGFDVSVLEIWSALAAGAELHLAEEDATASGAHVVDWLTRHRVTVAFLPTSLAELALAAPWPEDSPLRVLATGGDVLRRRPAKDARHTVTNNYGVAEATVVTTSGVVEPVEDGAAPNIGVPVPGARALVLDADLNPVGVGVPGELHIGGGGVASGYIERPDLTADRFGPDPFGPPGSRLYRTGDLVRWRADGALEYLHRLDHQVQIRGFRVEPGEVEAVLLADPRIAEAVVLDREDDVVGRYLVAYVVAEPGAALSSESVREHARTALPDYMVPTAVVALPALPMTANGKTDRAALPEPSRGERAGGAPPRTADERAIATIWRDLLDIDPIGVHDDFFALGGHSLLATKVVARIAVDLGRSLPVRQVFETRTVAGLAAALAPGPDERAADPVVVRRDRHRRRPPATP